MAVWKLRIGLAAGAGLLLALVPGQGVMAASPGAGAHPGINCAVRSQACPEVWDSQSVFGHDVYVGHDEPSALFYSNKPGAGNHNQYVLQLPKDPPTQPNGTDSGGTFNFQLHPAFWFGMALCDTQSAPEFTNQCAPNSDANIFDDPNPASPRYIGRHPGTAFMELQFYPPGWAQWPAGNSCDTRQWCAAVNIFSLLQNQNTGQLNNADCQAKVGVEPGNFAFVTKNGRSQAPAGPLNATLATFTPDRNQDLFMRSGDAIRVNLFDTAGGFKVTLADETRGTAGSMTASPANGFQQVNFQPNATTCMATPLAFHPMYSTSSEHTRVPWAAHSYNVAFSDETGHFQYCNSVDTTTGNCLVAGGRDAGAAPDGDDNGCFAASQLPAGSVRVSGCLGTDADFDSPVYFNNWPGTLANAAQDRKLHAQPIRFTSPVTTDSRQFDRVAFEADLPRIESTCNRTTGAGCVNPPPNTAFYPIFTTHQFQDGEACNWQLGGAHIPGTTNTFGGSSTTEYGSLLQLTYPGPGFAPIHRFNDYRQVLSSNPCRAASGTDDSAAA
jgi:hypothetical protein